MATTWEGEVMEGSALDEANLEIGGGFKLLIDNGTYFLIIQPARSDTSWSTVTMDSEA